MICLLMILNVSAYENVFPEHQFFAKKCKRIVNESMFTAKCDRYRQTLITTQFKWILCEPTAKVAITVVIII